jgi:hypothetical protein
MSEAEDGDCGRFEDFAGTGDGAFGGDALMMDEDGGIDRAIHEDGIEACEEGSAIDEDEVEIEPEACHEAGPGGAGEEGAGAADSGAEGAESEGSAGLFEEDGIETNSAGEMIFQTVLRDETELASQAGTDEVGIDESGAEGEILEDACEGEEERGSSFRAEAAGEEDDAFVVLEG